jgi:hypothetical protein
MNISETPEGSQMEGFQVGVGRGSGQGPRGSQAKGKEQEDWNAIETKVAIS